VVIIRKVEDNGDGTMKAIVTMKKLSFGDPAGTGWHLDPKPIARAAPAVPAIMDYLRCLLDQATAYHAMTLDY
jgi:hypothetical protein